MLMPMANKSAELSYLCIYNICLPLRSAHIKASILKFVKVYNCTVYMSPGNAALRTRPSHGEDLAGS